MLGIEELEAVISSVASISVIEERHGTKTILNTQEIAEAVLDKLNEKVSSVGTDPLEPLKIEAALSSELMKLNYRQKCDPKAISSLDYTVIACLQKCLNERKEFI